MIRRSRSPRSRGRRPYDIENLVETMLRFAPDVAEHAGALASGALGAERMSARVRVAAHLRLARVLRCPVCLAALPTLARTVGLPPHQIDAALEGRVEELPEALAGTVAWAGAVAEARGEIPVEWPDAARAMTMRQREQVLALTRLELVVHAVGLLVVPEPLLGAPPDEPRTIR